MRIRPEIYRFAGRRTGIPSPGPMFLRCPACGGKAHVKIGIRNAMRRAIDTGDKARASGCGMCPRCLYDFGVSVQVDAEDFTPGLHTEIDWDISDED